jgi:genome maintenance exonuclease 1
VQLIKEKDKFKVTDFKRENKYKYAEYTRDDDHGPRTYAVKDKKVPSVTTILSATQPEEKRKSLDAWRERVGYQEAQAITKKAALRGTEMHYVLEQYLNGTGYLNLSEDGGKARMMAHEIITHLEPLKIIYGNEVNLAYYFQIAAYSLAHQEQHGPIDQGLICICTKDGQYQEFKMDSRKLDEYENKWFERIERYEKSLKKGS